MVREFLASLREHPAALTRAQKLLFTVFTIVIAASRIPALSLTLHDWDETLFALAVREYDVKPHHPHPPGYPLFVVLGKFAHLFTNTEFHALQAVATAGSMLIFPAAFFLARELRFRIAFAFGAAAAAAFLPNVWYYGGTALSDVPALALILTACALLLRGGRSARAYVAGALLVAAACCIRPHLLMVAFVPALAGALALRRWKTAIAAWSVAGACVVLAYVGAAFFSTDFPNGYLEELRHIRKHIARTDSYRNPMRTPLDRLAPRAFLFPCGGGRAKYAIAALAALALLEALVRRRINVAVVVAMFLPMAVFTWLMLDVTALSRYAIAYIPLHAFLMVAGIQAVSQLLPRRADVPLFIVLTAFVTWSLIKWTWPALRFARTEPSPVVAAFQWIRANVPKEGPRVFVHLPLVYHAQYFLPDYPYQLVADERHWTDDDFAAGNIYVFEGDTHHPDPRWFKRKRLQLYEITRPRFFEIGVVSMHKVLRWGRGWHLPEGDRDHQWRWMARQSTMKLAPALYGAGELRLKLHAPVDVTPRLPTITVTWNGKVIDRVQPSPKDGKVELRYLLPSYHDWPNELGLSTDQWIRPKDDGRELGLSLLSISWSEPPPR